MGCTISKGPPTRQKPATCKEARPEGRRHPRRAKAMTPTTRPYTGTHPATTSGHLGGRMDGASTMRLVEKNLSASYTRVEHCCSGHAALHRGEQGVAPGDRHRVDGHEEMLHHGYLGEGRHDENDGYLEDDCTVDCGADTGECSDSSESDGYICGD
ncbi:hypothetical protein K458DRAFT_405955 [Lentithecium fluviatile CBS 122367]|uniref:Uncharacterized protein n=1 Tax=Lentithecium fluviatile CBS 122367 TaxID=1168545 RepID=A0A6G1IVR4_9PLEO|nr:hypothetical protein K458DRAFT_405955 [Lentithecium fluviatile CBS 122367]